MGDAKALLPQNANCDEIGKCVDHLLELIRQGRLRDNPLEALACAMSIITCIVTRLSGQDERFGQAAGDEDLALDCQKLCNELAPKTAAAAAAGNAVPEQLLKLTIDLLIKLISERLKDWLQE